ncbi:bifunctional diguanylate cyclase/phosphodiesterase [Alkalihalobacillus sp. BA299]|uniref:putative bifunctional diguanylate cyclase/phosphodiesterase n=1 Tax=Alkalihalobacillus sp. BA299 TaxID=2815938 RepID=UPI001ADB76D9|nr:EAL domain-containing protein [Alkalihalobacillus sp. BA299]
MKYRGRIFTIFIIIILCSLFLIHHYLYMNDHFPYFETVMTITLIIIAWWMGTQYDKVQFQQKELNKFALAMESSMDGMAILNVEGEFEYINNAHANIYGYTRRELFHKTWRDLYDPKTSDWINENVIPLLITNGAWTGEIIGVRKNGEHFPQQLSLSIISKANGIVCVVRDITSRKEAEEKIHHMAYHDMLTGLPNRYTYNDHMEKALARAKRNNQQLAVMFIDLDRFKFINDTLGHKAGDDLLIQVSKRLVNSVREADIVVRLGGDEFIILLENITASQSKEIAERIIQAFTASFILQENEEFFTSPSIGISIYPYDGQDAETLTKHADQAMYLAKKRGKNNYQFYIHEKESIVDRKIKLERGLKKAIDNDEFKLYYQPKIELSTRKIYGVEALLRWEHPELGFVPPYEFIPIAEEIGMIIPIGTWVLQKACTQNKKWQSKGIKVKINVNVSAVQFEDSFLDQVKETLHKTHLKPEFLGLEITESVMQNIAESSVIIQEIKSIGVKISIDDFGTGYSSLSVLNKLPIDYVKIDQSFINEILTNVNTALLVKTIIEMGKNLNFALIAEGIETEQQAEFLIQNGCHYGQGFFYSSPLPADEVEKLLMKKQV